MSETDPLPATLKSVVGAANVLTDAALAAAYETDWTRRWTGRSRCVVRPGNTAEVAQVLRECDALGAAVVPQGGNTGLVGGGVPRGGEVLLSLGRLREVEPVDVAAGEVTVGAGVTLAQVHVLAAAAGLAYGVDYASRDSATIGGSVATNGGGIHVLRHGSTRAQVRGLEAVLADGSVLRRLPGLVKDGTGYDLPGLLAGSEGTLAVITRVRLRLVPRAAEHAVALLAVPSTAAAVAVGGRLRAALPSLSALEVMYAEGLELVRRHCGATPPFMTAHPVVVLVEVAGPAGVADSLHAVLAGETGLLDAAVGLDAADRRAMWAVRERHTEALTAAGIPVKLDVAVPVPRLPELEQLVRPALERAAPGATWVLWGHLGDGNLHVNVLGAQGREQAVEQAVLTLVARLDGSIAAEHGVGVAKTRWLHLTRSPADLAAQRAIKTALDPAGRLNPGVLLPIR